MVFQIEYLYTGILEIFCWIVEGCAGFGSNVIASPIINSMFDPSFGVPYSTGMALPILWICTLRSIRQISWKDLGKILLACLPGVLLGNYLLQVLDPTIAKIGIGTAVVLIALININKHIIQPYVFKKPVDEDAPESRLHKAYRIVCLLVGSTVQGAFTIGGPLITVYSLATIKDKVIFRNTMLAFFTFVDTFNFLNQGRHGAFTPELWSGLLIAVPGTLIGFYIGNKILHKVNRAQFLRMVYVVLFFVGGNLLIRSILALVA